MSFENTSNFDDYQKYLRVKSTLKFEYKGIDISKALAFELINLIMFKTQSFGFWRSFKMLFIRIDLSHLKKSFKKYDVVFTTLFDGRKDHRDLLLKIQESVNNSTRAHITPHKVGFNIKISNFCNLYLHIFKNQVIRELNLGSKISLWFKSLYLCNQIDELEHNFGTHILSNKKYIPFNSSDGIEALLTLFFNKKKVATYHMYHGIFGRYIDRIANDIINGENITAKFALPFGEVTKHDMKQDFGWEEHNLHIAGNPKYPLKNIEVKKTFRHCLVLGGFSFYDKDFIKLLIELNELSKESNISFSVKPHPNSKILTYPEIAECEGVDFLPKEQKVNDLLASDVFDFAIAFNTVTYYECMYYNLITLRYAVSENLNFEGLNDRFEDKESLLQMINSKKATSAHILNKEISDLLVKTLGMGINKYNDIICGVA